ncbi:helix-turn-helix transcriptional regulator [Parapusillimonas sp. SGNA-6]|nr:helix-turn-helix transcriptional regulator [Parapusillimonas sp. SGNA-6]
MKRVSGPVDGEGHLCRVGRAIRRIRKSQGISQEELAHLAQIDRSHMGKIERGERNVTLLNLIRIARALSAEASALLKDAGL